MRELQNTTLRTAQHNEVLHDLHMHRNKTSLKSHNSTVMTGENQEITPVNHFLVNTANSDIAGKESGKRNMADLLQKVEHASILNSKILTCFNKMAEDVNAQNTKDSEILQQDFDIKLNEIEGFIKQGMNEGVFSGPNVTIGTSFSDDGSEIEEKLYLNFIPKKDEGVTLKFSCEITEVKVGGDNHIVEDNDENADCSLDENQNVETVARFVLDYKSENDINAMIEELNKVTGRNFTKSTTNKNGRFEDCIKIDDIDEMQLSIKINDNKELYLDGEIAHIAAEGLKLVNGNKEIKDSEDAKRKAIYGIIDDMEQGISNAYDTKKYISTSFTGDRLSYNLGQLDLSMMYKKYTENPERLSLKDLSVKEREDIASKINDAQNHVKHYGSKLRATIASIKSKEELYEHQIASHKHHIISLNNVDDTELIKNIMACYVMMRYMQSIALTEQSTNQRGIDKQLAALDRMIHS